nr:upf0157 protein [Quercus suber]
MPSRTVNGVPLEAILEPSEFDVANVERIAHRTVKGPELAIVEPDSQWLVHFQTFKSRILAAFEPHGPVGVLSRHGQDGDEEAGGVKILSIDHVGSTSVPNLPAKAVIDIDLVLSPNSLSSEAFYVPRLEAAGFQFLLREPPWHGHRFFAAWEPMSCNLHVWGPLCPEAARHQIFKRWLTEHEDDRALYARTKKECAALSREKGEDVATYNLRKEAVIRDILLRAFKGLGYLDDDGK